MAYNTGNPVGSASPKDLFDNAENLDKAVNGMASRTWVDRKGVTRRTYYGFEMDFKDFITASGFVNLGAYGAGLAISNFNQTFIKEGLAYRAAPSLVLPYTTTGDWGVEGASFVIAGDSTLRQDLAAAEGAALVGYRISNLTPLLTVQELLRASGEVNVIAMGAVGNGVADDTAAIVAAEAAAFAIGGTLLFPHGHTFNFANTLTLRVPLRGYGATMVNITATEKPALIDSKIVLATDAAAVVGLRIVCNHKAGGIHAIGNAVAVVQDAVVIAPINAGVSFVAVGKAVSKNIAVIDVRVSAAMPENAAGVFGLNCGIFDLSGMECQGFQEAAVKVLQTVAGVKVAKVEGVSHSGGLFGSGIQFLCGVFVNGVYSSMIDGIYGSNMPKSGGSGIVCNVGMMTNTWDSVAVVQRCQFNGTAVGGNSNCNILIFGVDNQNLQLVLSEIDTTAANYALVVYGGCKSISASNLIGRSMTNADGESSGICHIAMDNPNGFVNISGVSDISPRISSDHSSLSLGIFGDIILRDCASDISLSYNYSAASFTISNCQQLTIKSEGSEISKNLFVIGSNLVPSNSGASLFGGADVRLIGSTFGSSSKGFTSSSSQPKNITISGCTFINTPISLAEISSNISGTDIVSKIAGSPITFGNGAVGGARVTIQGVNIDMVDGAAYPIARLGAGSPASFLISGVHWSGGMPDVTNFNLAQGVVGLTKRTA